MSLRDEMHHVVDVIFDRFENGGAAATDADVAPSDKAPADEPGPNTEPIGTPELDPATSSGSADYTAPPAVQSDLNAAPPEAHQGQPEPGAQG